MEEPEAERFIDQLYIHILKRPPSKKELAFWTDLAMQQTPLAILTAFTTSKEYLNKRAVASTFTPGHYHSPVVDPSTVASYHARSRAEQAEDLHGIQLDLQGMLSFWDRHLAFTAAFPFQEARSDNLRFHFDGSPYPWGDAIMLRTMIHAYKPKRIIEIGSGFSTACMLDSADECRLDSLHITCIEPYPDRLHSLMREADYTRVTVRPILVQDMDPADVDTLGKGDVLFIDSTHVLKTGSDVHFELFSILPRLRPGVLVHVHDCQFPFEYPPQWVFDLNYSWNEIYALRAFLMYNERFSVLFWNSLLAATNRAKIAADCPDFLRNPGSSIWLMSN